MILRAAGALLLALGGPLAAQDAAGRWSLQVRGPVEVDRGDLRLGGDGGRLLLESEDTLWRSVEGLTVRGDRIAFRVAGGRAYSGRLTGDEMAGTVSDPDGIAFPWRAFRIQPGTERWPVRPRVAVRQLLVGTAGGSSAYPAAWREAVPPASALVAEHAALAAAAGLPPADPDGIAARAADVALGFDSHGLTMAESVLRLIAAGPSADATFRSLFIAADGSWRVDLHTVAWQAARDQVAAEALTAAPLRRLLELLGMPAEAAGDAELRRLVWTYWQRAAADRSGLDRLAALPEAELARAALGLGALLAGYDLAEAWWQEAVTWLMTQRWIDSGGDALSPVELVAALWERDDLALPPLEVRHFGTPQAVPVIGAGPLGARLVGAANAVADEYLAAPGGFEVALEGWRSLEFIEATPLRLVLGGESIALASPASVARGRLGGFLASRDAIRIESAIVPVLAVGTVIHEWQHLLLEGSRLTGAPAPGLREEPWGLRLLEGDPWLAEGAAEWLTEAVLAPGGPVVMPIRLMEAEKRIAIGARAPDDTHTLGYLLVRAAANRLEDPRLMRRLLVASLHDPRALAAVAGFEGAATAPLVRPSTLVMIPEVRFTMDGGVADGASRRLILPDSPSDP